MKAKNRDLHKWFLQRKSIIMFITLWSIIFSLIVIKIYWMSYATNFALSYLRIPYTDYSGPSPDILDMLIIAVTSLVAGFVLRDAKEVVYGYVATISLAFVLGVAFVALYIWGPLGWSQELSYSTYGWEWALLLAIWNVFRIMFPLLVANALACLIVGVFLRQYIEP